MNTHSNLAAKAKPFAFTFAFTFAFVCVAGFYDEQKSLRTEAGKTPSSSELGFSNLNDSQARTASIGSDPFGTLARDRIKSSGRRAPARRTPRLGSYAVYDSTIGTASNGTGNSFAWAEFEWRANVDDKYLLRSDCQFGGSPVRRLIGSGGGLTEGVRTDTLAAAARLGRPSLCRRTGTRRPFQFWPLQ